MDPDLDMIADDNEMKKDTDSTPKCICGTALVLTKADACYDDCKSIECDLCEEEVSGSTNVYHCSNKSPKHEDGYDVCMFCGMRLGASPTQISTFTSQSDSFYDNIFSALCHLQKQKNLISSPLSILIAMSVCMCGADGATLKQMLSVLHPKEKQKVSFENAVAITQKILNICDYFNKEYSGGKTSVVKIANKIWIKKGYKILDTYINAVRKQNVDTLDLSNAQNAANVVNKWCAENTNDMITEIVDKNSIKGTIMLIANAIYFKGKFVNKFPKDKTKKNTSFYTNKKRDQKKSKVNMMYNLTVQRFIKEYKGANGGKYDVVKLQYKNSKLSLILAINNYSIRDKPLLTVKDLSKMNYKSGKLHLYVPKFKFEFEMILNDVLKTMGIKEAFGDAADFSNMTGNKELQIDLVIHKAVIEVDEEGTVAAAVTVVKMKKKGRARKPPPIPTIRFNHPFSFFIYDEVNEIVLFSGIYTGK